MTATLQTLVLIISGSVALLADTIHNLAGALTAVPLWIAFALSRRPATRRYTYGYGRVEDLAGLFIVIMITLSALLAGYESMRGFFEPQTVTNLPWVLIASVIGFAGNELVAMYRIQVGRRIGSAALVADGVHARTDGFTSLAVVLGIIGVWLGFPLADPIVGLVITIAILFCCGAPPVISGADCLTALTRVLWRTPRKRWARCRASPASKMCGCAGQGTGSTWATVTSDPAMPVGRFHELKHEADQIIRSQLSGINAVRLNPSAHPTASVAGTVWVASRSLE